MDALTLKLKPIDDAWFSVLGDPVAIDLLANHLTFEKPGAKYSPAYRRGHWDGRVRILKADRRLYRGLAHRVKEFCDENAITLDYTFPEPKRPAADDIKAMVTSLNLPPQYTIRDYQYRMLVNAIRYQRRTFLSPTSSGKSLSIYLILSWFKQKTLIIVPQIGHVHQMVNDFIEYGCSPDKLHKCPMEGVWTDKQITVSTWHTAVKQPPEWFEQFRVVIGDEAHTAKAESLVKIFTSLTNCPVKIGLTGTLDGKKVSQLIIEGMFGEVERIITTKELIDRGQVAKPKVNIIMLEHPEWARKKLRQTISQERAKKKKEHKNPTGTAFREEQKWLLGCEARTKFIENLIMSKTKNTLVMFHRVEVQGIPLHERLKPRMEEAGRPLYLVHGKIEGDEREEIRQAMETHTDAVWLASMGTTQMGISVKRIYNLIMTASFKAIVPILQAIGRGLRLVEGKESVEIYDLCDDMSVGAFVNSSLNHIEERIKIYDQELFEYKIHRVKLNYEEKVIDGNHGGLHEVAVRGRNHGATGTVEP